MESQQLIKQLRAQDRRRRHRDLSILGGRASGVELCDARVMLDGAGDVYKKTPIKTHSLALPYFKDTPT